jgi:uncharacterized protein (DUF1015 family)
VGDGNHSLASAKAVWEEYKAAHPAEKEHSARYALVEIVNMYDEGLTFEPIHRVIFNANAQDIISFIAARLTAKTISCATQSELISIVEKSTHTFGIAAHNETQNATQYFDCAQHRYTLLDAPLSGLAVSALQPVLDDYLLQHKECAIDYIHGKEELFHLTQKNGAVSIMLPPVAKDSFFSTIVNTGVLPRKSFSMGEASEKRFYFECRRLF